MVIPFFFVAAVALIALQSATAVSAAVVPATICATPSNAELTTAALHAKHAVSYYASNYSNVAFTFKMLGTTGEPTSKNYVTAWILSGAECDAYVGPGYSRLAVPISPLIGATVAWVDPFATAVELSNKAEYPTFSRVIPSDTVSAKITAFAMNALGWADINILCLEDAYGRSISTGMTEAIAENGGTTHISRCVQPSDPISRAISILIDIRDNSPTTVVFMAMLVSPTPDGRPFFDLLIDEIIAQGLDRSLIFFFSETACSASIFAYGNLSSALCASYTTNARMDPFLASYLARNTTPDVVDLAAVGVNASNIKLLDTSIVAALMHDAALQVMGAISTKAQGAASGTIIDFVRRQRTAGVTGDIVLDTNGDRQLADARVYNAVGDLRHVAIGVVEDGAFSFTNAAGVKQATPPVLTLLGKPMSTVPPALKPVPAPDDNNTVFVIALCTGIGLLVVLAVVVGLILFFCRTDSRDNSNAPTDQSKPFTIMFTDIQASTALWARAPEQMSAAVETHHALMRKLISRHKGYEVKTISDAFMIAFERPRPAVELAMALQCAFFDTPWETDVIDDTYRELLREAAAEGPVDFEFYERDWNGLRVRVGIHHGTGTITQDEVTNGYDYFGAVVNTAARVEAASHGGQTCVTDAVLGQIGVPASTSDNNGNNGNDCSGSNKKVDVSGVIATTLGPQPLRGLSQPVNMTQLVPDRFAGRMFPPLRLDADAHVADDETDSDSKYDVGSVSRSTAEAPLGHVANRVAARIARKAGTDLDTERLRLLDLVDYTKSLFSTSKAAFRVRTIAEIAQKWRTSVDERKMSAHDVAYELALIKVVERVTMSLDAAKRHGYDRRPSVAHEELLGGSRRGSSSLSGSARFSASASGSHTPHSPHSPNAERSGRRRSTHHQRE